MLKFKIEKMLKFKNETLPIFIYIYIKYIKNKSKKIINK